ncbi:MAG: PilZ domain-containing protein [Spirochaetaceae bacterium]|nr:PilZ domain-containing protein [Spirochaetaceae bacterium]
MEQNDFLGKKVFFLYPQSVIQDSVLDTLIMSGFEVYTLHDHQRARLLLTHFAGSILFINIDQGLQEREWEAYIRSIQEDPVAKESRLGILSYNTDQKLMQKYLIDLAIPCGYVQLKLGLQASTEILLAALKANEAKGRRKCIRAFCIDDEYATMNYKGPDAMYYGKLLDISSAGVAVRFEQPITMPANTLLRGIQLKLRSSLIMTDGVLMGPRPGDRHVRVILFSHRMSHQDKLAIHHYIKRRIQHHIDQLKI